MKKIIILLLCGFSMFGVINFNNVSALEKNVIEDNQAMPRYIGKLERTIEKICYSYPAPESLYYEEYVNSFLCRGTLGLTKVIENGQYWIATYNGYISGTL